MIVISDNSPLSALAEIGLLELLPQLYGRVIIPESVRREAGHPSAPEELRRWISQPPEWLEIAPDPGTILTETLNLGAGESAAISLAWLHRDDALLIVDDKAARMVCLALHLRLTGLGGVLVAAARAGLVDFEDCLYRLQQTSFHLGNNLVTELRGKIASP